MLTINSKKIPQSTRRTTYRNIDEYASRVANIQGALRRRKTTPPGPVGRGVSLTNSVLRGSNVSYLTDMKATSGDPPFQAWTAGMTLGENRLGCFSQIHGTATAASVSILSIAPQAA